MTLIGKTWRKELNGDVALNTGWILSLKFRGLCWWHHSNEAGCRVLQCGPAVLEMW